MIYLDNITSAQEVYIPHEGLADLAQGVTFSLRSTIGKAVVYSSTIGEITREGAYFVITVELPAGLAIGEYEYCVEQGGVVCNGLAQLGEYSKGARQGTSGTIEIKQAQ